MFVSIQCNHFEKTLLAIIFRIGTKLKREWVLTRIAAYSKQTQRERETEKRKYEFVNEFFVFAFLLLIPIMDLSVIGTLDQQ